MANAGRTTGLGKSLEFLLHGEEGHLSVVYDQHGKELRRSLARAPRAGCTIITSLSLPLQKLATRILAESKRPGAFVAMNADTGEILAQASYPSFDNNVFLPAISAPRYEELTQHPGNLFFDRAVSGLYPPGSTFKPIVALATLESGAVLGTYTTFSGPPAYTVDGKVFRNWYKGDEGYLDVRFALLRSCNTWFYQAAIKAGSNPVLEMARRFGMGQMPALPLEGVAAGNLPAGAMGSRATANLSIGQGETLTSPLQMAIAMCAIANGKGLPSPQLIRQIQDPKTGESLRDFYPAHTPLHVRSSNLNDVRAGMWGVVNHSGGTGRSAALSSPKVYGKTGTSQWFVDGEERRLAWFTGFVQSTNPQIAFAVLSEGQPGESISGGGKAAPLAGKFLRTFYDNPSQYGFTPESLPKTDPLRIAATSLTSGSMQGNTATSDSLPTRFTFHPVAGIPKKANSSIYRKGTTNYNSGRFTVRARGLSKFSSRGGLFSRRRR
ncbi:MAG: penicillin-binding transpeptidase domain-containing protein [Verrucomicrobiota bacterium]